MNILAANNQIAITGTSTIPQGQFLDADGTLLSPTIISNYICFDKDLASIGCYAFHNCNDVTSVALPQTVTSVGYFAFSNCTNITSPIYNNKIFARLPIGTSSYSIPEGITEIASAAFRECTLLTNISVPTSVTKIDESAFAYCSSLASITLPSKITEIGDCAFWHCDNLTEIHVESKNPATIKSNTFGNVDKASCVLFVPEGCTQAYKTASYWKEFGNIAEVANHDAYIITTFAGDYTNSSANSILNKTIADIPASKPLVIDLEQTTAFPTGGTITVNNPNTLIKTATDLNLGNSHNVVINGVCSNLKLTDKCPFFNESDFTATLVNYSREMTSSWGTLCLPFGIKSNDNIDLYVLDTSDLTSQVLVFTKVSEVDANTPCIVRKRNQCSFDSQEITIKATPDALQNNPTDNWVMYGSYVTQTVGASTSSSYNYYIQGDTFYKNVQTVTIPPFRAWFVCTVTNKAPNRFSISTEDKTMSIENVRSDSDKQYIDLQGHNVKNVQPGEIYILNGQKVSFK